ncbi:hypothetical protein CDAR_310081 [Caerostris darwini]|uniref:Uncharacterized protein n=1 Tax=Caerostris darwini TaxID=1538125 RepID=A0AAV4WQQ7_9ARAC|nr:hypothetical protein CDAR_310081 [Caerostris darwini]
MPKISIHSSIQDGGISFSNEQHLQDSKADQNHRVLFAHPPSPSLRYGVEEKPMRYLNDQPMRCSSPWQRDPVNRSRGDDLPIIRIGMRKRKKKKSLTMWFSRRRSRDFWESRFCRGYL